MSNMNQDDNKLFTAGVDSSSQLQHFGPHQREMIRRYAAAKSRKVILDMFRVARQKKPGTTIAQCIAYYGREGCFERDVEDAIQWSIRKIAGCRKHPDGSTDKFKTDEELCDHILYLLKHRAGKRIQ